MSGFFLVVVICMFAGDAIASEASWGNLRYLLVRPVGRGRLLTAKLFVAAVFALLSTALVALSGLIVGVIAFGWHPLADPVQRAVAVAERASSCTSRSRWCSSPGGSPR